jgi:hypothetical protein
LLVNLLNILNSFILGEAANNYSLTMFVKVSDIYGAVTTQEATVTVMPVPLDVSAVNKLAGAVDSDFESGDLAKAAGLWKPYFYTG